MPEPVATAPSAPTAAPPSETAAAPAMSDFDPIALASDQPSETGAPQPGVESAQTQPTPAEPAILQIGPYKGTQEQIDQQVRARQADHDRMEAANRKYAERLERLEAMLDQRGAAPQPTAEAPIEEPTEDDLLNDPASFARKQKAWAARMVQDAVKPFKESAEAHTRRVNRATFDQALQSVPREIETNLTTFPQKFKNALVKSTREELEQYPERYGQAEDGMVTGVDVLAATGNVIRKNFNQIANHLMEMGEERALERLKAGKTANVTLPPGGGTDPGGMGGEELPPEAASEIEAMRKFTGGMNL